MSDPTDLKEDLDKNLEDFEIQEVLRNGTDLREYALQIDKNIKDAEKSSVADYLKESENIGSLHNQIEECDGILEKMESMLMVFQNDLGSISNEIISLQKRSVSMSVQLSNRQVLKGPLSSFIEDMAVSETLIFGINNVPVTEKEFMIQLAILNQKLNFVKEQDFKETKACHDVKDVLEKLKIKSVAKIRTYILEQIYKFRKPMANYQIPQNAMLKYKFFFEFVLANERNVAQEICNEYIDTLSKVYYSYFKSYASRLDKLKYEELPTKEDLMGIEDGSKGGFFQKANLKNKSTIFTIGNRGDVLAQQLEAPIIVPHVQQKTKYSYEALFRSLQYALVDNGCREYLFISEFFHVKGSHAQELFDRILGKTLSLLVKNVENYVLECYDCLALFLCIQLINRYRWMCHKRAVAALDSYWDSLSSSLWPRLDYVLKLNIQSVRECDPAKLSNKELGPHYITRRYAEFSAAMLSLSEQFPSEELSNILLVLQDEVHCFLLKMAAEFPQRVQQLIFLINNYDMVLSILMERTRDNTKEAESFREQLQARSSEYVEEILSPHFGGLIQFVKEGEQLLETNKKNDLATLERKSLALVASFSTGWKQSLEEIHREVLVSFPNLVTGSGLLQMALTNFVQYYHKFVKLLTPNARTQLITRRYAEFSAAMLSLSEQFPSEELSNILLVLQDEVHCFLLKMAAEFPQRVQQLIFLINNYDMVLSILMERTRDNTKEAESFREQLQARSSEYVEEILSPHFGGLIQFVKEGEQLLETNKKNDLATLERKSLALVASFSTGWKQSLEEIHREVLVSFPNLVTGSGLLQMALTNFVQYYHKFVKLLTPNARTQLVNIHVIMVEIKKYKTNY